MNLLKTFTYPPSTLSTYNNIGSYYLLNICCVTGILHILSLLYLTPALISQVDIICKVINCLG